MTDPIIEAAARALQKEALLFDYPDECSEIARAVLAAVEPLIRATALEEAARVAEDKAEKLDSNEAWGAAVDIAAAIRSLKEQP